LSVRKYISDGKITIFLYEMNGKCILQQEQLYLLEEGSSLLSSARISLFYLLGGMVICKYPYIFWRKVIVCYL